MPAEPSREKTRNVRVFISGRVQGVWYRDWTQRTARELGLSGWVRNRRDGRVEAMFCGPYSAVGEMIVRCHSGSPRAEVEDVEVLEEATASTAGFEVRPTV